MADEKNLVDEIDLADFNFDELLDENDDVSSSVNIEGKKAEDNDVLADISADDINIDDILGDDKKEVNQRNEEPVNNIEDDLLGVQIDENIKETNSIEKDIDLAETDVNEISKSDQEDIIDKNYDGVWEEDEEQKTTQINENIEQISDKVENMDLSLKNEEDNDINKEEINTAEENIDSSEISEENIIENDVEEKVEPFSLEKNNEPTGFDISDEEDLNEDHAEYFAEENVYNVQDEQTKITNIDIKEVPNACYVKWYSGESKDKVFEIGKGFESGSFEADEECNTLHINVGYDTYGWEVQFSDGVVMSLRDVREYQIRNGRLPSKDGRIIFGQNTLNFSGVERIVVYESVKYFSYGI